MRKVAGPDGALYIAASRVAVIAIVIVSLASAGWPAVFGTDEGTPAVSRESFAPAPDQVVATGLFIPTNDWSDRLGSDDYWRAKRGGSPSGYPQGFGGWSAPASRKEVPYGVTRIPQTERTGSQPRTEGEKALTKGKAGSAAIKKASASKDEDDKDKDEEDDESPWTKGESRGTYRTLCVRMCDGYYWPISFSTNKDNLGRDAKVCERTCGSPAKLFYHENPGQQPEEMEDLRGKRYKDLKVAFLYRKQYDAACTCKPQPWDEASLARHQRFADLADRKKGGKKVAQSEIKRSPHIVTASNTSAEAALLPVAFGDGAPQHPAALGETGRLDMMALALPANLQALSRARRQCLVPAAGAIRAHAALNIPKIRHGTTLNQTPIRSNRFPQQSAASSMPQYHPWDVPVEPKTISAREDADWPVRVVRGATGARGQTAFPAMSPDKSAGKVTVFKPGHKLPASQAARESVMQPRPLGPDAGRILADGAESQVR